MDSPASQHLNYQTHTMTNKEILQASVLDIIFEHRNKDYGAYALRTGYNKRLLTALGAGMSAILLLALMSVIKKNETASVSVKKDREEIIIRSVRLPEEKLKEPEQPKALVKQKPVTLKIAQVKFTPPKIVETVKDQMASVEDIKGKIVSTQHVAGDPEDKKVIPLAQPLENPVGSGPRVVENETEFRIHEKDPEFPGGAEAMRKFLARYLSTPGEMQAGEKKVVRIRFKVDKDGSVNSFEIETSGGNEFDNEVVRVCKKMPRWMPAIQNGINVPVSYVLPVTFIGVEE
ncbi:MAG: TonB family protein [Chitinophagaceae bacterium]